MEKPKTQLSFDFTDFFALGIAVACFILISQGVDTTVGLVLTSVISFYFGRKNSK